MTKHILSIFAFMLVTFGVQGLSHFVINKSHFDAVGFLRPEPIIALGFLVMILQGGAMSIALHGWKGSNVTLVDALLVAFVFGIFFISYTAFSEPAKYTVPSVFAWARIEITAGVIQFGISGFLFGLIHSRF